MAWDRRAAVFLAILILACGGWARAARRSAERSFQTVIVHPGDTLWGIAHVWLRDPAKWDEILKYNRLPASDPTVALPGMTLRVPVVLIKEDMRAATLIYLLNRVSFRRQDTADWKSAAEELQLYRGDSLRTFENSKAKVRFVNAELLSLDANSMAIIKPVTRDYDVELKSGGVFVGRSRVVTASARITPKTRDAEYSARVRSDLSTLVEVYKGVAAVDAQGKSVDVPAGMGAEIKLGMAPSLPKLIADLPEFEARAAAFKGEAVAGQARIELDARLRIPNAVSADEISSSGDINDLGTSLKGLSIGIPVSGYHIQAARNRDFAEIIFDKHYSVDEPVRLGDENIAPGVYYWRVAVIDLLGTEQAFSAPRLYSFGVMRTTKGAMNLNTSFSLLRPAGDEIVSSDTYRVMGLVKTENLTVQVAGKPARTDESGNFFATVKLKEGANVIAIQVRDGYGHVTTLTRRVTYVPAKASSSSSVLPPGLR
ncbi:MAG TPA: hypothetical protein DEB40_02095 [Elusimicrobia bacterium]|nr:hypothetical protein [Elusimicrobiota bacterium]HBT60522.1 hypothetical protein [Elusimicrobiota bacterium]